MTITQKKALNTTTFVFHDSELHYSINGPAGSSSFKVEYQDVPDERSELEERQIWFRNIGVLWIIIGAVQIYLQLSEHGRLGLPFWFLLGVGCLGYYWFSATKFTVFDSARGRMFVIVDKKQAAILSEIRNRRANQLKRGYAKILAPIDPDGEATRLPLTFDNTLKAVTSLPSNAPEGETQAPPQLPSAASAAERLQRLEQLKQQNPANVFRYFCGPHTDMSLAKGDGHCSLCGQRGPLFELEDAHCPSLAPDAKESALGCFECLQKGLFEFWHDTEIGLLDEDGLTHFYNDHNPPPPDFPASALVELRRTPQIVTWQQESWLTHCNDFMAYIGTWEPEDFYANAPSGDGRALFLEMTNNNNLWDKSLQAEAERLENWYATFYAFRCLHCGKLRGNWDCP